MSEFKRLNDETIQKYLIRLGAKSKEYGWNKLGDVLNTITGSEYSPDSWRKWYAKELNDGYNYTKINPVIDFISDDIYDKNDIQVQDLQRELERMKIKFRDQRNAWSKQNYADARIEETLELLEEKMSSIGKIEFKSLPINIYESDNDILVMLSDFHIGQCFSSAFGEYNIDVAKQRLNKLINEVIKIKKRHNSQRCYVCCLGDMISGNIRKTIQVTNKENVIDQIKIATELIASFTYEMCANFNEVFLASVVGNHTRLDLKEDALHDERLDDIISWGVELTLKGVENFHVLHRNIDSGIVDLSIRGKTYIGVHGDYDSFTKRGVSDLVMMLGFKPYAVLFGHLHTCAFDESHEIKMIRGGCLPGSGDNYTIEKRLSGKPSQMVCVCDKYGVQAYYPVEL